MNIIYIYYLHKGDNIPFYIGKTKSPKNRISGHRLKYGLDTFLETIDSVNEYEWRFWEQYWIDQFYQWDFSLKNQRKGGGGTDKHTIKTKQKLSAIWEQKSQKEKDKINKKRGLGNKGKSKPGVGRNSFTPEERIALGKRAYYKSKSFLDQCKTPILMLDKNTEEVIKEFDSVTEASYHVGVKQGTLSGCLTGRSKTSGGYKWKYKY